MAKKYDANGFLDLGLSKKETSKKYDDNGFLILSAPATPKKQVAKRNTSVGDFRQLDARVSKDDIERSNVPKLNLNIKKAFTSRNTTEYNRLTKLKQEADERKLMLDHPTVSKIVSKWKSTVNAPDKIPGVSRAAYTAGQFIAPGGTQKAPTTGNVVGDVISDIAGTVIGFGMPGGAARITDKIGKTAMNSLTATKALGKLPTKMAPTIKNAIYSGASGGTFGAGQAAQEGKDIKGIAKNAGKVALENIAGDLALGAAGKALNKILGKKKIAGNGKIIIEQLDELEIEVAKDIGVDWDNMNVTQKQKIRDLVARNIKQSDVIYSDQFGNSSSKLGQKQISPANEIKQLMSPEAAKSNRRNLLSKQNGNPFVNFKRSQTPLKKAGEAYNEGIETVQNYFRTNELRTNEVDQIPRLGVDLDNLTNRLGKEESKLLTPFKELPKVGAERVRLGNIAGVMEPPKISRSLSKETNKFYPPPTKDVKTTYDTPLTHEMKQREANALKAGLPKRKSANTISLTEAKRGFTINIAKSQKLKNPLSNQKPTATTAKTLDDVIRNAPQKKDISGFRAYTTDVYRNFEKVFGDDFQAVKKAVLDPFDRAKKAKVLEDRKLMASLRENIVKPFNIQKGSKESALVQKFGEKKITQEELVKQVGKDKANNIMKADKWFRSEYDRLISEVNDVMAQIYPNNPEKIIPRRDDYYRHFKDMSDTFGGLKNIFETPSQISPKLAGMSEFTKPKQKFLSFAQKRGNGDFDNDAVGGFLEYINAATYAKHIDPQTGNFRQLAKSLQDSTEQSANMNNFIGYLTDFANDLAGKTNPADRFIQKVIPGGRATMNALNWANTRVKKNTLLANLASSLSQIANVPQGVAYVKNPAYLTKGAGKTFAGFLGNKGPIDESGFILERYADSMARQFDTKLLDKTENIASWVLGALDEVGTKFTWNSVYQKALKEGIENPVKHADDITRKLVAGRGIGEVPLIQKSKLFQLVAPFTLEVSNLWKVQKDFVKAKDFGGLAMLFIGNHIINKGIEQVRGSGVTFDPIQATIDAFTEEDISPIERAGRLAGEVVSNVPLGSTIATMYPEYGIHNELVDLPTREKLFGRNDPTRFGSGPLVVKAMQDPLYKILPSFGGGQIKKTVQAGQDLGVLPKITKEGLKKQDYPASYSITKSGKKLRTPINKTVPTTIKGLAFGRGGIPEMQEFYKSGNQPMGTKQTEKFDKLVKSGFEPNKLFKDLQKVSEFSKKEERVRELHKLGYATGEVRKISTEYFDYKFK